MAQANAGKGDRDRTKDREAFRNNMDKIDWSKRRDGAKSYIKDKKNANSN